MVDVDYTLELQLSQWWLESMVPLPLPGRMRNLHMLVLEGIQKVCCFCRTGICCQRFLSWPVPQPFSPKINTEAYIINMAY